VRRFVVAALVLAGAACASTTSVRRTMPTSAREWLTALTNAKTASSAGRYDEADRTLYDFAQLYAGAPEAREAAYWRAVFKLDPANRSASPRAAVEQLDVYLTDSTSALHVTEALVLRRLALSLDSLSQNRIVTTRQPVTAEPAPDDAAAGQERQQELQKEIQRLKDSLDRSTAELERIKKRLAPPPATPAPGTPPTSK
jgi:HAMP domain-containing protein